MAVACLSQTFQKMHTTDDWWDALGHRRDFFSCRETRVFKSLVTILARIVGVAWLRFWLPRGPRDPGDQGRTQGGPGRAQGGPGRAQGRPRAQGPTGRPRETQGRPRGLYRRRCCDPCWWKGSHFPCSRGPSYHLTKTRLMWTEPPDAPRSAKNKVKAEPHSSGRNLCRQYKDAKLRGDCAREPAFAPWWACFPSTVLLPRSPCFKPFHPQARERPA